MGPSLRPNEPTWFVFWVPRSGMLFKIEGETALILGQQHYLISLYIDWLLRHGLGKKSSFMCQVLSLYLYRSASLLVCCSFTQ